MLECPDPVTLACVYDVPRYTWGAFSSFSRARMLGLAMRGKALFLAGLTAAVVVLVGCHHDKYGIKYKQKETCVLPPDETRYNEPPSAEYRAPPAKGDDKSLLNNQNNGKMGGPLTTSGFK